MALLGKPTGPVVEMTTGAHADSNQKTMLGFFSPPPRRGGRAKAAETRGRKAAVSQSLPARKPPRHGKGPAVPQPAPQAAATPKQTRTNFPKGENLKKLTQAVAEWADGSGRAAPREFLGEPEQPRKPSLAEFTGEDPKKPNKKEIVSIALKYYGVELAESRKKDGLIAALEKEIASKPTVLASVSLCHCTRRRSYGGYFRAGSLECNRLREQR